MVNSAESSDAALARELQLEEYGGSGIKRQRTDQKHLAITNSEDEFSLDWDGPSASNGQVSPQPKPRRSLRSRQEPQIVDDTPMMDVDADALLANALEGLDELEDTDYTDDYVYSSDDNASELDAGSPEAEENVQIDPRPVQRRSRASNTTRRRSRAVRAVPPPLPYHMGGRVRNDSYITNFNKHC